MTVTEAAGTMDVPAADGPSANHLIVWPDGRAVLFTSEFMDEYRKAKRG